MSEIFRSVTVVGVVNATPDSFSDGGRFVSQSGVDLERGVDLAAELVSAGAGVLDVGGESTRPGAEEVSAELECDRVVPLIEALAKRFPTPLSVDTRKAQVADAALAAGARVVNDVSGLRHEPAVAGVAARHGAEIILGHSRETPKTMQRDPHYDDLIEEVGAELSVSVAVARAAGIAEAAIVIDPGLGFGKRWEDNHVLLARLAELRARVGGQHAVLVGPSRKAFLGRLTGDTPLERDIATFAACAIAVYEGAEAVRVHDVAGAVRACAVAQALRAARREIAP